ncbi:HNH endonuclease [Thermomonas carbonis]|uniref:HNH endonuclease n=1 Tax=Thermomonas carbonis TaxID=1463158 RepID=UPI001673F3E7|nr:hypothetical protein GCM10010080_04570 [Thermomonas carbonis]
MTATRYGNGRGGRPWRRLRDAVAIRDGYKCYVCGRIVEQGECDHIVPVSKGGKTEMGNLGWICPPCHADKSEREAAEAQGRNVRIKARIGVDGWPM